MAIKIIVENIDFESPKTKDFEALLKSFNVDTEVKVDGKVKKLRKKSLLVLSKPNKNVYLSARNIQKTGVVLSSDMNTYNILNTSVILLTEDALADIENNLKD